MEWFVDKMSSVLLLMREEWDRLIEMCERSIVVMKRGLLTTWSQGRSVIDYLFSLEGERRSTHVRGKDGWWRGNVWRDSRRSPATGGCTRGKSILSLQRKKFMKLEHKRSHVQLAALNLRGEAGEEVGRDAVIKTSEEANKACRWSMIPASRNSHSPHGCFPLRDALCWRDRLFCRLRLYQSGFNLWTYLNITSSHVLRHIKTLCFE